MLQVLQHQKTGDIKVEELPAPECLDNGILVRTEYSLISAGTEKTSVTNTQSSLIQRAKKQPDQVKMVLDYVKKEGVLSTYQRVISKLEDYKLLGYSLSGIVIESKCDDFSVGDRVACAGAGYANHAEYVTIPKNLACKIPDNVDSKEAAFTTLASIALQGVRQADVRLGENIAVIGLGLLGQITIQLLKSAGCKVIGLDINEKLFEKAKSYGADAVYNSSFDYIKEIQAFTKGIGCDAVIITASTSSNEPMELAINLARKKGKVVVVGAIGMDIPRSPFYQKELDITISCSYGPGRYDPFYEELGNDYPIGWVRWTENRNMQAILNLLAENKLDFKSMTSHIFDINEAPKAYELITGKVKEEFTGILLKYPLKKVEASIIRTIKIRNNKPKSDVKIAFLGAGTFGQTYLIPNIKKTGADLIAVSTAEPSTALSAAKKFGFKYSSTDSIELIHNDEVNAVFIATQHNLHSKFVVESIKAGKTVYVEKPLALNFSELDEIDKAIVEHNGKVMLGFNRRFSKPFLDMKRFAIQSKSPKNMLYRVNAGYIPKGHWVQRPEQGGRIIGEVCHFIDCMVFLTDALPETVYCNSLSVADYEMKNRDNISLTIKFTDGSLGTILYMSNGDKSVPKEYCEMHCNGTSAIMNDFRTVEFHRASKTWTNKYDGRKGHKEEIFATIEAMKKGDDMPIPYEVIRAVTVATFKAEESLNTNKVLNIFE